MLEKSGIRSMTLYEFIPYDNKITTPYLYGLDSFEMKELTVFTSGKRRVLVPVIQERKKSYEIKINRGWYAVRWL